MSRVDCLPSAEVSIDDPAHSLCGRRAEDNRVRRIRRSWIRGHVYDQRISSQLSDAHIMGARQGAVVKIFAKPNRASRATCSYGFDRNSRHSSMVGTDMVGLSGVRGSTKLLG